MSEWRRVIVAACVAWAGVAPRAAEPQPPAAATGHAERMAEVGLIRHSGSWRTAQEIELLERSEREAAARREWKARVDKLRAQLDKPADAARAAEELRGIADPLGAQAVAAALATERVQRVRGLYVEALGRIGSPESFRALVAVALDHPDAETRLAAVERLATIGPDLAAPAFVAALASADNAQVNRAAEALGRLKLESTAQPLVASLETEHVGMRGSGPPAGSTSVTFTPSGGGLALGGGPKPVKLRVRNEKVREALAAITGVDHQWDVAAWRAWLAARAVPSASIDLRRD